MSEKPVVLSSTHPFGAQDPLPIKLLDEAGVELRFNPHGHRMSEAELADLIGDVDYLIAGTEPITAATMARAKKLKLIARVGIGLDSVDLNAARELGIAVSYTPDAPSPAVGELTIGLMVSLLRGVGQNDRAIRDGEWRRFMGRLLGECTVGIIGMGRIGKLVTRHLRGAFPGIKILANDIEPDREFGEQMGLEWVEKEALYTAADIITLHVPMTPLTRSMIGREELLMMGADSILINTARGGIVDEDDLAKVLNAGELAAAAVDVYSDEPYKGLLTSCENALLTCHIGSMADVCRGRMEIEATEDVLRFMRGDALRTPVPESEYEISG